MNTEQLTKTTLIGGALAAVAASACCLGPLVVLSLGIGGAWISGLTLLEPLRPVFIALALGCMVLAYREIYRSPAEQDCQPGSSCTIRETRPRYRVLFWMVSSLVVVALAYPFVMALLA